MPTIKVSGFTRVLAVMLFCPAIALPTGCSDTPPTTPVTGTVTYQGKPLSFGSVMFQHESGGQPARGKISSDGTYELSTFQRSDGARIGKSLVRITCFEGNDPARKPTGPEGEIVLGRSLIPRKYASFGASGLVVDVKPDGPQTFDFELED